MLDNGKRVNGTDKGLLRGKVVISMLDNGKRVNGTDKGLLRGKVVISMLDNGKRVNSTDKGLRLTIMEKLKKGFGKAASFSMFKNLKIHKFIYSINHT
jgi:hypothetical protein